jgi:hypothetical protein
MSLEIFAIPTDKSNIYQRAVMREGIIPRHPSVNLFSGRAGSGKSNLMVSLLTRPEFYGAGDSKRHYFDHIVLIVPTVDGSDDLYKSLEDQKVPITRVTDPTADDIQNILDFQKQQIKQHGISKASRTLLLLEDMQVHSVGKNSVMSSKPFLELFLANRHNNLSVWMAPRRCRLQSRGLFYFAGSASELDLVSQEYGAPGLSKKEMAQMISHATKAPFSFLFVNMHLPWATRYRANLDVILKLER